jgi:hypothetical protein
MIASYLEVSSQNYHNSTAFYLFLVYLSNFSLDLLLIENKKKTPNGIDSRICWIKGLIGVAGILTIISGLYFIIISVRMHISNNANMARHRQIVRIENVQEIETERNKDNMDVEDLHNENNEGGHKEATDNSSKILNSSILRPDTVIQKEQNASPKIPYETPINRSVSAVKTKPEEVVKIIIRPHPILIINSAPSNRGESIPLEDKLISKEPVKDYELIDYSETATSPKTLEDLFEDIKPLNNQESVQNNDEFDKDNLRHPVSIPFVDTTTDQEPDNRFFTGESLVKFPIVGPENTASLTKDIDFPTHQESEEAVHPDPTCISLNWEVVEEKRIKHNKNKDKMDAILDSKDDVFSDETELNSSQLKEKPAGNQNQGYDLQFPQDTLKCLDSRYYPVLKNIEGLTEISTENFTKILIQCNLGAISLTPTFDDINEWAEEVLKFENPLLEMQENTIRINKQ